METLTFVHVIGVVTETKLIKIPLHVLAAYPTVSSVYGTFAIIAPKRFNGISICATVNVDTVAMVNNMVVIQFADCLVALPFIRVHFGSTLNLTQYWHCKLLVGGILDHFTNHAAPHVRECP